MSDSAKRIAIPVLLVAGLAALSLAWLMGNPPGAAPDEPAALMKALAAGHGQLLGARREFHSPATSALQAENRRLIRFVSIPAKLAPLQLFGCNAYRPATPASCTGPNSRGISDLDLPPPEERHPSHHGRVERRTDLGTYQPFVSVVPGLFARLGSSPASADRLARLASASLCFALVVCAIFLLWVPGQGGLPLLGLLFALTPMTVFVWSSTLSGSGPEVAGGILTFAAILRLARAGPTPRWIWLALAAGGAALCGSRPLGPVLLAAELGLGALILGAVAARQRLREGGKAALAAGTAIGVALVADFSWQLIVQPSRSGDLGRVGHFFTANLLDVYRETIGVFGWLDTRMNHWAYVVWTLLFVALLATAFLAGRGRQRWTLAAAVAAPVLVGAIASVFFNPAVGRVQGRWLLPIAVAAPMLAGEIVWRHRERLNPARTGWVVAAAAVLLAAIQLEGWYANARRQAVGVLGPHNFFTRDVPDLWSPPLGWIPWLVVALLGAAAIAAFGLLAMRDRRHPSATTTT